MSDRCEDCRFWKFAHQEGADRYGDCRRRAPRARSCIDRHTVETLGYIAWALIESAKIEHHEMEVEPRYLDSVADWPMTTDSDWCGEYVAAP